MQRRNILITGASSGIGAALALKYSRPGTQIVAAGRDRERLSGVASKCEDRGAKVAQWIIDVRDISQYICELGKFDDVYKFDYAIFSAGNRRRD